jgi:hypothetical protein
MTFADLDVGELRVHNRIIMYMDNTIVNGHPVHPYPEIQWADINVIDPATGKPKVYFEDVAHLIDINGVKHWHRCFYGPDPTEPNGRKHWLCMEAPVNGVGVPRIVVDSASLVFEHNEKIYPNPSIYLEDTVNGLYYQLSSANGKLSLHRQDPPPRGGAVD